MFAIFIYKKEIINMIRQDIVINNYKYIVDVFKAETNDMEDTNFYTEFIMLRNYEYKNDIVYDTDIYIIQKDLIEEYITNYGIKDNKIVFPVAVEKFIGYSTLYTDFNSNYSDKTFLNKKYDLYDLYERKNNEFVKAKLPCDKVRIYHPHHKTSINAIVYFDNYINSVHFHWFCRPMKYLTETTYADDSFNIDNIQYSEYAEFYIPSPEKVINKNIFYIENLNDTYIKDYIDLTIKDELIEEDDKAFVLTESTVKNVETERSNVHVYEKLPDYAQLVYSPTNKWNYANKTYMSMYTFTIPFTIEKSENSDSYKKTYLPELKQLVINNYVAYPLNITIFPYSDIINNRYVADTNLVQNSDMIYSEVKFTLAAKPGFDENGIISIISTFNYPNKEKFDNFRDAYKYYYGVDLKDYEGIIDDEDEDYNEDNPVDQKQCGFKIELFSDYKLKHHVYSAYFEIEHPDEELDDFLFQMNNVFVDWKQLPEILMCRTKFTDKYLGNVFYSNTFLITKEQFKYMINSTDNGRISFTGTQNKLDKISNMDLSKFNFIDKVNCVIKRENTEQNSTNDIQKNKPRVMYQPVFFKTADLQNITIRSGFTQNIGVNLAEYMTKVDSFTMIINGIEYIEFARNDIYVIFKINANEIINSTGSYHIINQDKEYISSGQYTIN